MRRDMGMRRRRECQSACVQPPRIGRERRGKACVALAPQSIRPPMQAEPSDASPCRVALCPGTPVPFFGGTVVLCYRLSADVGAGMMFQVIRDIGMSRFRMTSRLARPRTQM